jgi:hypothetical protein
VKGLVAHPFYRMEKSLPGRRAEPKNVYLMTLAYDAKAERIIENSIRRNIGRWLLGRNQETY